MIGQALLGGEEILRVTAEDLRAREHRHARRGAEFGKRRGEPIGGARAVDRGARLGEQRTAELGLLVEQHDARAGPARRQRGREPRRPGADDGDVAMGVFERVMIGIGIARRPPMPAARRMNGS